MYEQKVAYFVLMVSLHGQLTLSKNNGEESVHEGISRLG